MSLQIDPVLGLLGLLIGAMLFYALDEVLSLTPRLAVWLGRMLDEG